MRYLPIFNQSDVEGPRDLGSDAAQISPQPVVKFLHIPKTAGNFIGRAFVNAIGERCCQRWDSPKELLSDLDSQADQGHLLGYRFLGGHVNPEDLASLKLGPEISFTVLRDPRDRALSLMAYLKAMASHLDDDELRLPRHAGKSFLRERGFTEVLFDSGSAVGKFVRAAFDNPYVFAFGTGQLHGGMRFLQGSHDPEVIGDTYDHALERLSGYDYVVPFQGVVEFVTHLFATHGFDGSQIPRRPTNQNLAWPVSRRRLDLLRSPSDDAALEKLVFLDEELLRAAETLPNFFRITDG